MGTSEGEHYERVLRENLEHLEHLERLVRPGVVVLLHDPQTAGLVEGMRRTGAHVIWRSHIGRDDPSADTDRGGFPGRYLENADAFVFSGQRYVPDWLASDRVRVIAPSIDPFSAKNRELADGEVGLVLRKGRADRRW